MGKAGRERGGGRRARANLVELLEDGGILRVPIAFLAEETVEGASGRVGGRGAGENDKHRW